MTTAIVRLFEDHTKLAMHYDDAGLFISTTPIQSFKDLVAKDIGKLIVLLPGTQIHILTVEVPAMSSAELQQAVPNILEEELAEDISELHFIIGEADAHNRRTVAVMRLSIWQQLLSELDQADCHANFITADFLALPWEAQSWSIYVDSESALVKCSDDRGFSCDPNLLNTLINQTLSEQEAPEQVTVYAPANTELPQLDIASAKNSQTTNFENLISPPVIEKSAFNFLQRQRRKKSQTTERSYWYWCGVSFACFIAILFLGQVALYINFKATSRSLNQQLLSTYQRVIPGIQSLDQPKFRTEEILKQYELAPNPLMVMLQRIGQVKDKNPLIQVITLSYSNNKLTLTISATSNDSLNQFNQQLTANNLKIISNQTNNTDKNISETITVEAV